MKKTGKRTLSLLLAAVMVLSLVVIPGWSVQAEELDVNTLPEELQDIDLARIKQYDATYFTDPAGMGSVLVEDADSPLGQAYYNEGLAMGSWLSTAHRNNYGSEKWLVDVQGGTVPIDGQYHFYEYTWAVPADLSADNADIGVYHGGKWIASNQQIAQDVDAYKGETVVFYVSIKIDGTAESTKCYVDQMILVLPESGTTEPEPTEPTTPQDNILPEELQDLDPRHIKQYDVSYFSDPEGTGSYAVDDEASPLGKAWYIEGLPMGSWLSLGYRALLGPGNAQNYWPIDINGSEYPIDGQYHFYKSTWTVPEDLSTEENWFFVYHSGQWVCYNYQMAEDIEAYIGKTVDIYLSMKIGGTSDSTELYVDQMILAEQCVGGSCPVCGEALDVATLPEELQDVDPLHIRQYDASYFTDPAGMGSVLVEDADSPLGQAYYNEGLAMGGWLSTAYRNNYGSEQWLVDVPGNTVSIDGQYHFYKFTWNVPTNLSADNADIGVYHGGKWIASNEKIAQAALAYKGKTVDFYVSIKIDGTAESTKFYVDQMILVTHCEDFNDDFVCSECGKSLLDETLPEEVQKLDTRHYKRYTSADFLNDGLGSVVSDTDSPLGSAYKANAMPLGIWTEVYRYATDGSQAILLSENYIDDVTPNLNAGYKFYKRTLELPETFAEDAIIYVRHNNEWVCQFRTLADDMKAYAGKTVDFYFSFKVTGTAESCELYIDQMILVERCENYWDEGTVIQAPTEDADGAKSHICGLCGAEGTEVLLKLSPVSTWNLVLDGNICMNLNINVTAKEAANATVEVTVNGETITKNVADLKSGDKYVLDLELAAAQMADAVTVTLNKGGESYTKNYSVRGYADIILADAEGIYTEEAKNLVKYMLAYGAASQAYFKYNDAEENLADKGIEVTPATVPAEGGVYSVTGSAEGVKYFGSSLVYRNKIAVRIYFSGDVTGKTFTVNGETVEVESKGDLYYIEVADIYPQNLADGITVAVDGLSVTYSPMDYIIRMYAKGSDSAALVQALYGYYLAAVAYIA